MPHLDSETFEAWKLVERVVREHQGTIRAALEQRRSYFVSAATDARRAHLAGALSEPAEPGHLLLIDNAGLAQVALLYKHQAESCVRALRALNEATEDDYTYEIEWEVTW